jgi:hypothetical protein
MTDKGPRCLSPDSERSKMSKKPPKTPEPPPIGRRPDLVVVPVNQPLPPGPGLDWWLRRITGKK